MKNILLAGKFNDEFSKLNKELSRSFSVQLCSDDLELLQGIMKMGKYDIVVVSADGMGEDKRELFEFLGGQSGKIPVVCIGKREELVFVHDIPECAGIKKVIKPISTSGITAAINESLGISIKAGQGASPKAGLGALSQTVRSSVKAVEQRNRGKSRKTILLVDDAAIQLRTMQSMLKKDYDVEMATSGKMAIDILRKNRPDLILLDYNMPNCDGKETFELILQEENGKDVPVVFVTGVNEKGRIMEALKLKPAGYLVKPVKRSDLMEIVQQTLQASEA